MTIAERRLKVCFISPGATSLFFSDLPPTHGGAEIQFYQVAKELTRRPGFDVHFVVHGPGGQKPGAEPGITLHCQPFVPGLGAKVRFQRLLSRVNADVYLQRGIGSVTKEVALHCLWRRRRFVYLVASEYDVDPSIPITELRRNRWFEWGMLRANLIVCQTRRQADCLKKNYGRDSLLLPSGLPAREPSHEKRDYVLWVGRLTPVKRPELFIELAQRVPQEQFIMIAPVSGKTAEQVFERCKPLIKATPNLIYQPGLPFDEVQRHYDRAKLLVNTSLSEGLPSTFLEAMWAGTPIASLTFDPDGMIAEHDLGIPPTDRLETFAEQVNTFLRSSERRERCSANAWKYANTHHNLTRYVDTLEDQLRKLLRK